MALSGKFVGELLLCVSLLSIWLSQKANCTEQRGCVYSFQVWSPDEDVLAKLRHLEAQCANNSWQLERQLLQLSVQIQRESTVCLNRTDLLERKLLKQEVSSQQRALEVKDVKIQLNEVHDEHGKLWDVFDQRPRRHQHSEVNDYGIGMGQEGSNKQIAALSGSLASLNSLVGQLKNRVGDLKAEWVLSKRDLHDISGNTQRLTRAHEALNQDTVQLKSMIEELRTDSSLLKEEQDKVGADNDRMKKTVSDIQRSLDLPLDGSSNEVIIGKNSLAQQVEQLQQLTTQLTLQVEVAHRQNIDIRREIATGMLSSKEISSADLREFVQNLIPIEIDSNKNKINPPRDCHDVYKNGNHVSGLYPIQPRGWPQMDNVYCEMVNETGWTLLQRRLDGSISFNRQWLEYKYGFGNMYGEFWLGNELMHLMTTTRNYRLRVDMWDWDGLRTFAEYETFSVDSQADAYKLHIRGHTGNAGDSLSAHEGMSFTTGDSDNDLSWRNCAEDHKGGWWYDNCYFANLNGVYRTSWYTGGTFADGIVWFTLKETEFYSLKKVEMKIRLYKV